MPLFLAAIFSSLLDFFLKYFTKKTALGLAAVGIFSAMTLGLAGLLSGLLLGITVAFPSSCYFTLLIPTGTSAMISAVISGHIARWAYDWHVENLRIMSYIT